jgi:predicted transcriptional regulator
MIAKELMTKHCLKQVEAARLLGISQPAISLYRRKIRGKAIDLERDRDVRILIKKLAESLVKGTTSHEDFILAFCEICRTIRAKGLMCKLHGVFDPAIDVQNCALCSAVTSNCVE